MNTFQPSKELAILVKVLKSEKLPFEELNEDHLLALANDHRIVSRICSHPNLLPEEIRTKFIKQAQQLKISQLRLTHELDRIHEILSNIPFLVLKGPLLSQILYNDPAERQSKDLDILIDIENLNAVIELLQQNGYSLITQFDTDKQREAIIKHYHHVSLYHEKNGIMLELHWNLTALKHLRIDVNNLFEKKQMVRVGNKDYRTLNEKDLIGYLCIHGVFHAFFRLQWLVDIHTLLKNRSKEEHYQLYTYFENEGIGDFYLITLAVLSEVLGLKIDKRLMEKYQTSRQLKQLVQICFEEINENDTYRFGPVKKGGFRNTVRNHRIQYLTGGIIGLMKSIESRNVRPQNWKTYVFPDRFFFLNNLFSRFIWLLGKMRRTNK